MTRTVDPVKATENMEWLVMYRAAAEIEELAQIAVMPFEVMTEGDKQKWDEHPLSYLGSKNLIAVAAWLDEQAEKVLEELKGADR